MVFSTRYAIGLLATDGCLSKDGRHIDFTSKDLELVQAIRDCLRISNRIGRSARGGERERKYYRVQFGSRTFYDFLVSVGLTPAKSRTIGPIRVPRGYFRDFLRGCIDGDGHINVFRHPESRQPQLVLRLVSASPRFLVWIKEEIAHCFGISRGWISKETRAYVLHYGKEDSIHIFRMLYYRGGWPSLSRKREVAKQFMRAWRNRKTREN